MLVLLCFILYSREDTEDAVKYISGTILDDHPIRVDFNWGFEDFRKEGNGVIVEVVDGGGYGKLVQKELEAQRRLVDYGAGSLGSFLLVMPPHFGRHDGGHGHGGPQHHGRDFHQWKRLLDDDRPPRESSKKTGSVLYSITGSVLYTIQNCCQQNDSVISHKKGVLF